MRLCFGNNCCVEELNPSSPSSSPTAEDVLSILTDKSSLAILKLLDGKEYSIQQMVSSLNLPMSSTYRKVNKLEHLHIIKKTKIVRKNDGTDESFYTSWIEDIQVTFKKNKIICKIKNREYYPDRIIRLWQGFK